MKVEPENCVKYLNFNAMNNFFCVTTSYILILNKDLDDWNTNRILLKSKIQFVNLNSILIGYIVYLIFCPRFNDKYSQGSLKTLAQQVIILIHSPSFISNPEIVRVAEGNNRIRASKNSWIIFVSLFFAVDLFYVLDRTYEKLAQRKADKLDLEEDYSMTSSSLSTRSYFLNYLHFSEEM